MCGQFPARVKAGGTGCESEKQKTIRLFPFPRPLSHLFSPLILFPPACSHGGTYLDISVGGKKSQTNPPQWDWRVEGKGRAGQERGGG